MSQATRARIVKTYGQRYVAETIEGAERFECTLAGKLRQRARQHRHPVSIGDWVSVLPSGVKGDHFPQARIDDIHPRDTQLLRAMQQGRNIIEVTLAANVDQVVLVKSVTNPPFRSGFVDRVLVACSAGDLPLVLVVNKWDLYPKLHDPTLLDQMIAYYRTLGVVVHETTASNHDGLDELRQSLAGKLSLFMGHSGVGKSTIVNALLAEDRQSTNVISDWTGKGQHTTTNSEIIALGEVDGEMIDSPGVREFGLTGIEPHDLGKHFVDFLPLIAECRFGNKCLHVQEPACAVRAAVDDGTIPIWRYDNYLRILETPVG